MDENVRHTQSSENPLLNHLLPDCPKNVKKNRSLTAVFPSHGMESLHSSWQTTPFVQ